MRKDFAHELVGKLYQLFFNRPVGPGAQGYINYLESGGSIDFVFGELQKSNEYREKSQALVNALYLEVLRRPADWPGAVGYLEALIAGRLDPDGIREELRNSDEYKDKFGSAQPIRSVPVRVSDNVLVDSQGYAEHGLSISLFFAMARPRSEYEAVIQELSVAGVDMVRFAGSTRGWEPPRTAYDGPLVDPFRPGTAELDPGYAAKLRSRLDFASRLGVRVQYTIFWGAFQEKFVTDKSQEFNGLRRLALKHYARAIGMIFADYPECSIEIINECNHGAHLGFLSNDDRIRFLDMIAGELRAVCSNPIAASDGGTEEFNYNAADLDYWNIHWARNTIAGESGIPKWARGVYHLHEAGNEFRRIHGQSYGRNDENMFLQADAAERATWPYRNATIDWKLYGLMGWNSVTANAGLTLHTQKGFFCIPGVSQDPIFRFVKAYRAITQDFTFKGAATKNTGWDEKIHGFVPVRSFGGGVFKAHMLVEKSRHRVLVTILKPRGGFLHVSVPSTYSAELYTGFDAGRPIKTWRVEPGETKLQLPESGYVTPDLGVLALCKDNRGEHA